MENKGNVQNNVIMDDLVDNSVKVDDADDFYYEGDQMDDNETADMNQLNNQPSVSTIADTIPTFEKNTMNVEKSEPVKETNNLTMPQVELPTLDNNINSQIVDIAKEAPVVEKAEQPQISNDKLESSINLDLSNKEIDEMIAKDKKEESLDDSYVLSNFDVLFDSLYSDVTGANNFISDLIEQKKTVNVNEANLAEMQEKLEKEKHEFAKLMEAQKKAIETEKEQCNEYVKTQHVRLQNEETKFNSDCEATRAELKLEEEKIKISNEKLEDEKNQFAKIKQLEEEKMKSDRENFETEKEQFKKETEITIEKLKQSQQELETQKEQFAKAKELEEKKLELESKNLSQSCARFKELVSQFNSGFQQLPVDGK